MPKLRRTSGQKMNDYLIGTMEKQQRVLNIGNEELAYACHMSPGTFTRRKKHAELFT